MPAETNRPSGTDEVSESVCPIRTKSLSVAATTTKGWKPSSKGCWENSHRPLPCSTPNSQMRRFCRGRHSVSFSSVTRTSDDLIFVCHVFDDAAMFLYVGPSRENSWWSSVLRGQHVVVGGDFRLGGGLQFPLPVVLVIFPPHSSPFCPSHLQRSIESSLRPVTSLTSSPQTSRSMQ